MRLENKVAIVTAPRAIWSDVCPTPLPLRGVCRRHAVVWTAQEIRALGLRALALQATNSGAVI